MKMHASLMTSVALGTVVALGAAVHADARTKHRAASGAAAQPSYNAQVQNEISELRSEVEALKAAQAANQQQTTEMKSQVEAADARAQAAEAKVATQIETIPGVVKTEVAAAQPTDGKLHIKGATLTFGGFVEAAGIYRNHNMQSDISTNFNALPYGNNIAGRTSEMRFTARQSRISGLAEGDVSSTIHLKGYGEFDFQGAAQTANSNQTNSYNPRIRQLYTTVDWDHTGYGLHLLAGQAWSLATMNHDGIVPRTELTPPQIDAQYVPGFVFTRQPQFRLTVDSNKTWWFALSAENPQTTYLSSGKFLPGVALTTNTAAGSGFNSVNTLSLNNVPDIIAKGATDQSVAGRKLHVEAFGIYRNVYARDAVTVAGATAAGNQNATAGGVGGGMWLQVVPKFLDFQVSGIWGYGVGRYLAGAMPDSTVTIDGRVEPIQEWGLLAGATWHPTPLFDIYAFGGEERQYQNYTSNISLKIYNGLGNPHYDNSGCEIEGSSACAGNTHFIDQATGGFWYKPYSGKYGRFQWGVQYSFTQRHSFAGLGYNPTANENIVMTAVRYYPF